MKTKRIYYFLTALFLIFTLSISGFASFAKDDKLSPAFDIIANQLNLIKTGLVNNDITFSAADFDNALGVNKVQSVTITSLPNITEGKLLLGSLEVMKNQTVSRSNLSLLRFVPSSRDTSQSSFDFIAGSNHNYSVTCTLYVIPGLNFAPTVSMLNDSSLSVSTFKNITLFATMKAGDPENDPLCFEIVKQPKNGILTLTDRQYGDYKYTPLSDFSGKDSFVYVARDKYGNFSDSVKINISVLKPKTDVIYTDMIGHWAHNAAIKMTAANIMFGEQIGSESIFNPDLPVSRCEFLVMAMNTLGHSCSVSTVDTGFSDDSDIPDKFKSYVATALRLGFISGYISDSGVASFNPNAFISRAEAAVILNNMLNAKQPVFKPAFADETILPAWAEDAIFALNELSVIKGTGEGNISPFSLLTRAQTAQILSTVLSLK